MWAAPGAHGARERDSRQPYPCPGQSGRGRACPNQARPREPKPNWPKPNWPDPNWPHSNRPEPSKFGPTAPGPNGPGPNKPDPGKPGSPWAPSGLARSSPDRRLFASYISGALALVGVGKEQLLAVYLVGLDRI